MSNPVAMKQVLRLVVFVPEKALEGFIKAIQDEIPSFLGPYDRVLWWGEVKSETGTEQFRPLEGSNPTEGTIFETMRLPSVRVEIALPFERALALEFIEKTIIPAHPWEKPVIYLETVEIVH